MLPTIEGLCETDLYQMYEIEKMSAPEIAKFYNVSYSTIYRRMEEWGIKVRALTDAHLYGNKRYYVVNEDFFSTWTAESAWVFGWFLSDGYLRDRTFGFKLARKDREVLEKIKKALDSKHPIKDCEDYVKNYQKWYKKSTVYFNSKRLVEALKNISYLDIPHGLFYHFVRGLFEGDGSVYWHNWKKRSGVATNFIFNDKNLLDYTYSLLKRFSIVKGGNMGRPSKYYWQLSFAVYDSIALYTYMYPKCNDLYLARKKTKFENLIRRWGNATTRNL